VSLPGDLSGRDYILILLPGSRGQYVLNLEVLTVVQGVGRMTDKLRLHHPRCHLRRRGRQYRLGRIRRRRLPRRRRRTSISCSPLSRPEEGAIVGDLVRSSALGSLACTFPCEVRRDLVDRDSVTGCSLTTT
jgi:hypothetical protein